MVRIPRWVADIIIALIAVGAAVGIMVAQAPARRRRIRLRPQDH